MRETIPPDQCARIKAHCLRLERLFAADAPDAPPRIEPLFIDRDRVTRLSPQPAPALVFSGHGLWSGIVLQWRDGAGFEPGPAMTREPGGEALIERANRMREQIPHEG
jgi:hypothetical protein